MIRIGELTSASVLLTQARQHTSQTTKTEADSVFECLFDPDALIQVVQEMWARDAPPRHGRDRVEDDFRRLARAASAHAILKDRAYIGEILHKGERYPGKHEKLIDCATWERVQALLGGHIYQSHALTYAGDLIQCAHCGHPITGEKVRKRMKSGERFYTYYRCTY